MILLPSITNKNIVTMIVFVMLGSIAGAEQAVQIDKGLPTETIAPQTREEVAAESEPRVEKGEGRPFIRTDTSESLPKSDSSPPAPTSLTTRDELPLERFVRKTLLFLALGSVAGLVLLWAGPWKAKATTTDSSSPLQLISSLAIAPRCSVSLIHAEGQTFLVARDAAGIKQVVPVKNDFEKYLDSDVITQASESTTPWQTN